MNKVGQIVPRGEDRWLLRVYLGKTLEGKRKYASKMFHGSKQDARKALTAMAGARDTQSLVSPNEMTVAQWIKQWLQSKVQITKATLVGYETHLKLYILPALGALRLQDLSPLHVQECYNQLQKRGLSPRVIEYSHSIFHQSLNKAVNLGFLVRNPSEHIERPAKERRGFTFLTPDQMDSLLKASEASGLRVLWMLLLTTGLRPGEALALRWSDLEGDTLRVNRTLQRVAKGRYEVAEGAAKTEGSLRAVTLPTSTLVALKEHRLRSGVAHGYIFSDARGNFLNPHNVRHRWKTALAKAGLPSNIRLYDTRHSHATALLNAGVALSGIADRLGHSSTRVTEQVYARVMPEMRKDVADTMETILRKASNA